MHRQQSTQVSDHKHPLCIKFSLMRVSLVTFCLVKFSLFISLDHHSYHNTHAKYGNHQGYISVAFEIYEKCEQVKQLQHNSSPSRDTGTCRCVSIQQSQYRAACNTWILYYLITVYRVRFLLGISYMF